MSNESYRKLRDQALDHRGVKIENRDSDYQRIDSLKDLFKNTADQQRKAPRRPTAAGIPSNAEGLGYDPRNGDIWDKD